MKKNIIYLVLIIAFIYSFICLALTNVKVVSNDSYLLNSISSRVDQVLSKVNNVESKLRQIEATTERIERNTR